MILKIEGLKETLSFYDWKLKDKGLTERQKNEFLKAKKIIEKMIKEKEDCRERGKHKKFIPYDHKKAVFLNKRGY